MAMGMELWSALVLGLAGSLHCAGMCGPLMLAMPGAEGGWGRRLTERGLYQLGRLGTYAALGVVFGLVGRSLAVAGLQRWVSILVGAAVLVGVLWPRSRLLTLPVAGPLRRLKGAFGRLWQRRTLPSFALLGGLNGLLPCGLVYVACAAAAAAGSVTRGVEYMLVFGLGTVPMMLTLSLAGSVFPTAWRLRWQRVVPVGLAVVGVLLILRGLALGIPYLSPDLVSGGACCH